MNKFSALRIATCVALSVYLSACSQQGVVPEATDNANATVVTTGSGGQASSTNGANIESGSGVNSTGSANYGRTNGASNPADYYTVDNLNDPASPLSKRIIYFDYDLATIKPEYQSILDAHAELLKRNPGMTVRLEGHADERGTREYNVALSEQRAKAVQWYLQGKSVDSSQTRIIAYGEERPAIVGDGEKSWAQNRRVELKYPGR